MITVCESTFSLGHGDPDGSLCDVYSMLLDANGTHHYRYIRCTMSQVLSNKYDYEPYVFFKNLFPLTRFSG